MAARLLDHAQDGLGERLAGAGDPDPDAVGEVELDRAHGLLGEVGEAQAGGELRQERR
jgi:hypothetical protein